MYLTNDVKKEIFTKYGKNEKDTGSPEAQVALVYTPHQTFDRACERKPQRPRDKTRPDYPGR